MNLISGREVGDESSASPVVSQAADVVGMKV